MSARVTRGAQTFHRMVQRVDDLEARMAELEQRAAAVLEEPAAADLEEKPAPPRKRAPAKPK